MPIKLPKHWDLEVSSFGVVLTARRDDGYAIGMVTVSERVRDYSLGVSPVRERACGAALKFEGLHWRKRLYQAAVIALCAAAGLAAPEFE